MAGSWILAFRCLRVKGEILWGLLAATLAALLLGVARWPAGVLAPMDFSTFWAPFATVKGTPAIAHMLSPALLTAVFALLLRFAGLLGVQSNATLHLVLFVVAVGSMAATMRTGPGS